MRRLRSGIHSIAVIVGIWNPASVVVSFELFKASFCLDLVVMDKL